MLEHVTSWGRLGVHDHVVVEPHFLDQAQAALSERGPILGFGLGRSYGDVCLNSGGRLLRTRALDRLINADWTTGIVRAEAGLTFDELLRLTVPKGWFLPVVPGTKFVTLGGAVANDVHGKNHETAGTFGCHVRRLGLSRSSGEVVELAPDQNSEFFAATIGGLGLTGIILWVEVALVRIGSAYVDVETLELADLDGFFRLAEQSQDWEFTVAWVDCLAKGAAIGRGLIHARKVAQKRRARAPPTASPRDAARCTALAIDQRHITAVQSSISRSAMGSRTSNYSLRSVLFPTRRGCWMEQVLRATWVFSASVRSSDIFGSRCDAAPARPDGHFRPRFVPHSAKNVRRPPVAGRTVVPPTGRHTCA